MSLSTSPILAAAASNDLHTVRWLVERESVPVDCSADWLVPDSSGVKSGVDGRQLERTRRTPLMVAASHGGLEVLSYLLRAGADPNARTMGKEYLKMTPAHWMVFGNKREALKILIDAGADVNAMNTKGETPTDMAWNLPKDTREGILTLLLENGGKKGDDLDEDPPEDDPDPAEATTATDDAEEGETAEEVEPAEEVETADAESAAEL
mmetsp:Transcript_3087/g.11491  ORF Transcript_3087/g.11491 Transcript_3087/m.11491 type:complete len:209 (-) Transcript_3087:46-672(-)